MWVFYWWILLAARTFFSFSFVRRLFRCGPNTLLSFFCVCDERITPSFYRQHLFKHFSQLHNLLILCYFHCSVVAVAQSLQAKLSFSSKEIVALSCAWCKTSYHNKESCFNPDRIGEECVLGELDFILIITPCRALDLVHLCLFKD